MAINYLTSVDGYGAASGDYPNGRIVNGDNLLDGTSLVFELFNDINQLFDKLIDDAGITKNGNPDNVSNGYQLLLALVDKIQKSLQGGVLSNLDNASFSGFYLADGSTSNRPVAATGHVVHSLVDSNNAYQVWTDTSNDIYVRRKSSGVWSTWEKFTKQSDFDVLNNSVNQASTNVILSATSGNFTVNSSTIKTVKIGSVRYTSGSAEFIVTSPTSSLSFAANIDNVFGDQVFGSNSRWPKLAGFMGNIGSIANSSDPDIVVRQLGLSDYELTNTSAFSVSDEIQLSFSCVIVD